MSDPGGRGRPVLVALAGGTASGKSTLAAALVGELSELDPVQLRQDDYFRDFAEYDDEERERVRTANHPSALRWDRFHVALDELMTGGCVVQPAPGTRGRARGQPERRLGPAGLVLVEGLFALWDQRCRERADLRLYTEAPDDERVLRRLQRDIAQRGSTLERAVAWYRRDVAPNHPLYTASSRDHADLVVPTGHATEVAVRTIAAAIRDLAGRNSHAVAGSGDGHP